MAVLRDIIAGRGFFGAVGQISVLTATSRILGFIRDILIAVFVGAGPVADAFFVAFKLPNLFRRITAEGAMINAFIPAYAEAKKHGDSVAQAFVVEIQATLFWVLCGIVIVMQIVMPWVIAILAPGFGAEGARYTMAVDLARLTMPYLPMISLVALWAGVANAHDRFFGGAAAPVIVNLFLIMGAVICGFGAWLEAVPLAVALPLSGIFQLLLMQKMLMKIGQRPKWVFWPYRQSAADRPKISRLAAVFWPYRQSAADRPKISRLAALFWPYRQSSAHAPYSRKMWRAFFPATISAGGMQINVFVDVILASLLPVGAISALYYADRIAQLPLGVIGFALGTALLPRLARFESGGDKKAVADTIANACHFGLFFALPSMAAAIILAETIIAGLFAYGAFAESQITVVALVLVGYAVGIPAFILAKILQPAFFAAGDTRSPLVIAIIVIVLNIIFSLILMQVLGAMGLALATSLASWVSVVLMGGLLYQRGSITLVRLRRFLPIVAMTAAMAVVLLIANGFFAVYSMPLSVGQYAAELFIQCALGAGVYIGLAWGFDWWPRAVSPVRRNS